MHLHCSRAAAPRVRVRAGGVFWMDAGRRTHTHLFLCPFSPSPTRAPCSVFVFALSTVEAIIFYKKKTLKELLVVVRS